MSPSQPREALYEPLVDVWWAFSVREAGLSRIFMASIKIDSKNKNTGDTFVK